MKIAPWVDDPDLDITRLPGEPEADYMDRRRIRFLDRERWRAQGHPPGLFEPLWAKPLTVAEPTDPPDLSASIECALWTARLSEYREAWARGWERPLVEPDLEGIRARERAIHVARDIGIPNPQPGLGLSGFSGFGGVNFVPDPVGFVERNLWPNPQFAWTIKQRINYLTKAIVGNYIRLPGMPEKLARAELMIYERFVQSGDPL